MKRFAALAAAALAIAPVASYAGTQTVTCPAGHNLRAGGTEIRASGIGFQNADPVNPATIQRITIRNFFGDVVHDSGPAIGVLHPLNRDFPGGWDITVVPPGAAYYLSTNHIWGPADLPGDFRGGFNMSITVQWSKEGKPDLFKVDAVQRVRERLSSPMPDGTIAFFEGAERVRTQLACF